MSTTSSGVSQELPIGFVYFETRSLLGSGHADSVDWQAS